MSALRAVIFANGELADLAVALAALQDGDWLIAADGGARHCRALGLTPDVVIGDFDSLPPGEFEALPEQGAELHLYPRRKDKTDLELALRHAVKGGAQDLLVLGALGLRWDQTLANLMLLTLPELASVRVRLADGNQQVTLIRGREVIEGRIGDTVSLIPLGGQARGVTTHGLEYPLANGILPFGSTLGLSNTLLGEQAVVEVREGLVACVVISESTNPHSANSPTAGFVDSER